MEKFLFIYYKFFIENATLDVFYMKFTLDNNFILIIIN